jgi:ABC-type dipeptide/oligopeptide/nickel transport system permease component
MHHLILPAAVLAAPEIAIVTRLLRSSMLAELKKDYVTFARAKGLSETRVVFGHALRNALVPAITAAGMQIGWMLAATVLVESIFSRVGIGAYAVNAVLQSDVQAIVAVVLVVAAVFVFVNFVVDLLYFWLNPKLQAASL